MGRQKNGASARRCFRNHGARSLASWQMAMSSTITLRLPRDKKTRERDEKCRKFDRVEFWAHRRSDFVRPQALGAKTGDGITGGCVRANRFPSSGGAHIRHRLPCLRRWHSSKFHNSTSSRLPNRQRFLEVGNRCWLRLTNLWPGFTPAESPLLEKPPAPAHAEATPLCRFKCSPNNLPWPIITQLSCARTPAATEFHLFLDPCERTRHGRSQ